MYVDVLQSIAIEGFMFAKLLRVTSNSGIVHPHRTRVTIAGFPPCPLINELVSAVTQLDDSTKQLGSQV